MSRLTQKIHSVPLVMLQMKRRAATKAIAFPRYHRGCSCLFIVHHYCLHGSDDAPQSIVASERTSEQPSVEAG